VLRAGTDPQRREQMGDLFQRIKPLLPTHPHPLVPGTATAQLLVGPLASIAVGSPTSSTADPAAGRRRASERCADRHRQPRPGSSAAPRPLCSVPRPHTSSATAWRPGHQRSDHEQPRRTARCWRTSIVEFAAAALAGTPDRTYRFAEPSNRRVAESEAEPCPGGGESATGSASGSTAVHAAPPRWFP
jgi:hypothetical protein